MIKIKYSLIVSTAALFGLSQFTINNSAYAQDAVRIGTSSVGSVFYTN